MKAFSFFLFSIPKSNHPTEKRKSSRRKKKKRNGIKIKKKFEPTNKKKRSL